MNKKNLIALLASIGLILVLVLTGCAQATTPSTPTAPSTPKTTPSTPQVVTKEVKPIVNVLNPAGSFVPVQTVSLAPRLDTLDGKTIAVIEDEADPVIMPVLYDRLAKDYPKNTWKRTFSQVTSPARLTADDQKVCQGAIIGIGW